MVGRDLPRSPGAVPSAVAACALIGRPPACSGRRPRRARPGAWCRRARRSTRSRRSQPERVCGSVEMMISAGGSAGLDLVHDRRRRGRGRRPRRSASMPAARSAASVWSSRSRGRPRRRLVDHPAVAGIVLGQMTVTRTGSVAGPRGGRRRSAASPATVWLATTRMCFIELKIASLCSGVAPASGRRRPAPRPPAPASWTVTIAWRAPGTPYSYGPPTTCGGSSKLKIGGGELTCHSSVSARHGLAGAIGPRAQLGSRCRGRPASRRPSTNAQIEMIEVQVAELRRRSRPPAAACPAAPASAWA